MSGPHGCFGRWVSAQVSECQGEEAFDVHNDSRSVRLKLGRMDFNHGSVRQLLHVRIGLGGASESPELCIARQPQRYVVAGYGDDHHEHCVSRLSGEYDEKGSNKQCQIGDLLVEVQEVESQSCRVRVGISCFVALSFPLALSAPSGWKNTIAS